MIVLSSCTWRGWPTTRSTGATRAALGQWWVCGVCHDHGFTGYLLPWTQLTTGAQGRDESRRVPLLARRSSRGAPRRRSVAIRWGSSSPCTSGAAAAVSGLMGLHFAMIRQTGFPRCRESRWRLKYSAPVPTRPARAFLAQRDRQMAVMVLCVLALLVFLGSCRAAGRRGLPRGAAPRGSRQPRAPRRRASSPMVFPGRVPVPAADAHAVPCSAPRPWAC